MKRKDKTGRFLAAYAAGMLLVAFAPGGMSASTGFTRTAVIDEEDITLTIRDLCGYFDPLEWSKAHGSDDSEKGIGLRIITGLAKDVRYFNAFNSNNIIFTIDRRNNETE